MTESELADTRATLERRARELARPLEDSAGPAPVASAGTVEILVIELAGERLGLPLDHIVEVHRAPAIHPIPGAQPPVIGVIAWRGRVLTIMDLAHARPGSPAVSEGTRIIVLGGRRAAFGLFADEVDDVRRIGVADLELPDDISPARAGLISGVTTDAVAVLDAAALLARYATPT